MALSALPLPPRMATTILATLEAAGIASVDDLCCLSRSALHLSTGMRGADLDLVEAALDRLSARTGIRYALATGGGHNAGQDGPVVHPQPWEAPPITPIRSQVGEETIRAMWIRSHKGEIQRVKARIREAGRGWPELRVWLEKRVDLPDLVLADLKAAA